MTAQAVATESVLHATCVAIDGRGILILGPSGSGKSALGLQLMALGARLVADDRTLVTRTGDTLVATCPPAISGVIEARGVGLIWAEPLTCAAVALVVDLAQVETDRLPPRRSITLCGIDCDLVLGLHSPHFPSSLLAYMKGGRQA